MNLTNQIVIHKAFGEGKIVEHNENYLTISFQVGEKKFIFPDAFKTFLSSKDASISEQIDALFEEDETQKLRVQQAIEHREKLERGRRIRELVPSAKKPKAKAYPRTNIAFKCNFCDGGQSAYQVGFDGVCSDMLIRNNIEIENRTWCNSNDCPCLHYHIKEITRQELDALCESNGFVCYESQMLRDWKAMAGVVQNGENKGKPMKLSQVQANSLCVLTTRDPQSKEEDRYIFAVFLVDETFDGDGYEEGYVSTKSHYKIKLSLSEAHSLLFWNYHANENKAETAVWSSGLHRYFKDVQAVQILKDIARIKAGTEDGQLASDFYEHFCRINGVDATTIGEPCGALLLNSN